MKIAPAVENLPDGRAICYDAYGYSVHAPDAMKLHEELGDKTHDPQTNLQRAKLWAQDHPL